MLHYPLSGNETAGTMAVKAYLCFINFKLKTDPVLGPPHNWVLPLKWMGKTFSRQKDPCRQEDKNSPFLPPRVQVLRCSSPAREFLRDITPFQRPFAISRRRWYSPCEVMDGKLSELTSEARLKGCWLSMINRAGRALLGLLVRNRTN